MCDFYLITSQLKSYSETGELAWLTAPGNKVHPGWGAMTAAIVDVDLILSAFRVVEACTQLTFFYTHIEPTTDLAELSTFRMCL